MRDLARRLLVASRKAGDPREHEVELVCETLRVSLTRFAGADGFTSLLRRALALASAEGPLLDGVKIGPDGRLVGLEQIPASKASDAAVALTAHVLLLLNTFIGEPLTLKLVQEAWPDESLDK
jgi:hypothetical protein